MLDSNLEAYWRGAGEDAALASDIAREALETPPGCAKVAARVLQVVRRGQLAGAPRHLVEQELEPHVAELRRGLAQVDQIANPETEPAAIAEILGEEAEGMDWGAFDADLMRSQRRAAGSRASAAEGFLDALDWDRLPETARPGLRTALDDLKAQERFKAQALLVGPAGEGFAFGMQLKLREDGEISSDDRLGEALRTQAARALHAAFGESTGGVIELEWALPVEGRSIGLAVVLAGHVARRELPVDPLTAATGAVDVNGAVLGVEGIGPKLEAAAEAGIRRVLLPEENRGEADASPAASTLELLFVSEVPMVKRALTRTAGGTQLGAAARRRVVRGAAKEARFEVEDEKQIAHGFQFKLADLEGTATLTLYDSGATVVGGNGGSKERAQAFVDRLLPAVTPEPRSRLTLRVKPAERQERVRKTLLSIDAAELEPGRHESWRFRLERSASKATVVQYSSGKLVLQGNAPAWDEAREALKSELEDLGGAEELDAVPDLVKVRERREQSDEPWIGTDESGKGDFFGPLVSAAVYADARQAETLAELGVADSKKLSDKRVFALAPQLREALGNAFYVTPIYPERFNSLDAEMRSEGKRLNAMLAWGHTRSIDSLLQKGFEPGYAIIDQFADGRFIRNALLSEARRSKLEILEFPKAEADIAVAAASILAREAFLSWLDKTSGELGLKLPKGAGPQVIEAGRELVAIHGEEALRKYAKLSFRTTQKVLA